VWRTRHNAGAVSHEREDEIAWRQQVLDEKEHELNRIEETLAEKERSPTAFFSV
jgi:hypothetical protein